MNNGKIKVYKNPARTRPDTHKPYVPQYQLLGVAPEEYKSPIPPGTTIAFQKTPHTSTQEDVRGQRPTIRQPYAEVVTSPVGRGRGPLPNVGNNLEQTWSSVDSNIIDDISGIDPDHPLVDNNDFVSEQALGYPPNAPVNQPYLTESVLEDVLQSESMFSTIRDLEEDSYLLMAMGANVCSGPLEFIQEQTTLLVFGEHELYQGNPISIDDIIVIKRVKLKVGVFLV